jgi:hypothetical protein
MVTGEQVPQGLFVDPAAPKGSVEATPTPPVDGRQAQVDRRRNQAGAKQGVSQLEQCVGSAAEAPVERISEGA